MKDSKMIALETAKDTLESLGVFYRELPNGQIQVDGVNYWSTKEKWYNPRTSERGIGFNSFLKHLRQIGTLE